MATAFAYIVCVALVALAAAAHVWALATLATLGALGCIYARQHAKNGDSHRGVRSHPAAH